MYLSSNITITAGDAVVDMTDVRELYNAAMRQSILNYILLDVDERSRLRINAVQPPYTPLTVESPAPWAQQFR